MQIAVKTGDLLFYVGGGSCKINRFKGSGTPHYSEDPEYTAGKPCIGRSIYVQDSANQRVADPNYEQGLA